MFRILGVALATTLTATAVTGIGALILSDFPEVRKGLGSVLSGTQEPARNATADLLKGVDDITLFIKTPIAGTSLEVSTGASFSSAENIAKRAPKKLWCYVNYGAGAVTSRIDLGTQSGTGKPIYASLRGLSANATRATGLDREALSKIARSHCKFSDFDPTKAYS